MSRTASMQFTLLTREEAIAYLARCPKTTESAGDRIAAARRVGDLPEPMPLAEFHRRFGHLRKERGR